MTGHASQRILSVAASVASVMHERAHKPASNCSTPGLTTRYVIPNQANRDGVRHIAAGTLCSHTNDVARAAKYCQAPPAAKTRRCRIKTQLPPISVHKPGTSIGREWHACTFVCKRYPHPDLPRSLQRNDRTGTTGMTQTPIRLAVNGRIHHVDAAPDTALLYVLRNDLELNGPKYGCGLGECGACAVLIDGVAARSCVIPISGCIDREILTLEGLGSRSHPDPVQDAFIQEQAAQCGYCLNGMIMTTKALLLRNKQPSESEAMEALRYNLCRCGAHVEILRAVMRAAGRHAEARD